MKRKYKVYAVGKPQYKTQRTVRLDVKIIICVLVGLFVHPLLGVLLFIFWLGR